MATDTPETESADLREQCEWKTELIRRECENSLSDYLGHVVINRSPHPMRWGDCMESWQWKLVQPIIPAIEHVSGLGESYSGPRNFLYVLPKGHDKTGLIGRLANWAGAYSRRPIEAVVASGTRDQAGILLRSMKAEIKLNPWLKERLFPTQSTISGTGGTIKVLSAEAWHSSGLTPDIVIMDEWSFWPNQELWQFLMTATEKRPECVVIIITNAGMKGSWQHDVLQKAQANRRMWVVYQTPPKTHLASWMSEQNIREKRELVPRGFARRVYDNEWIDSTETPLLTTEMIDGCECDPNDNCLWPNGIMPEGRLRDIYMGWDIGRSQDRSVVWTDELIGDVMTTREILVMDNVSFDDQEAAVISRMDARRRHVRRLHIDKGGIGMQMAERMEKRFPGVAEGFQLNASRQGAFALALQTAFKLHKVRIPRDPMLRADLQLIDQVETGGTGVPVLKTNKGVTGHGDRFWAKALAQSGLPVPNAPQKAGRVRFLPSTSRV